MRLEEEQEEWDCAESTLAVTPERLPLGLLAQRNWVRDDATFGALPSNKKRAIGDKESIKWLESIQALSVAREAAPQTTFVRVGDREAEVYELFAMERAAGIKLLVRGTVQVSMPRQPGAPGPGCTLALRSMTLPLKLPQARKRLGPVEVWAILATEVTPPPQRKPIKWLLLTDSALLGVDDVIERVHWYTC